MPTTITDPLDRMRYLVARSTHARASAWFDVATGDEATQLAAALARTFVRLVSPADFATLPIVLIEGAKNFRGNRTAEGGGAFNREFSIRVTFFDSYTLATPRDLAAERTAIGTFEATVDTILDDLLTLSGSSSHLRVSEFSESEPVGHSPPEASPAYISKTFTFTGRVQGSQSE